MLHLGVHEKPYVWSPKPVYPRPSMTKTGKLRKVSAKRMAKAYQGNAIARLAQTTVDVARVLEEKYGIMGKFFELHSSDIAQAFADSMEDALVNVFAGAPPSNNPYGDAEATIETMFKKFLEGEELAGVVPGVPTKAALKGRSKRLKKGKGGRRPSFVDTGGYEGSFAAWVDG